MNTRLRQFLLAENISQSQFADTIGVARASISHILSGRNKPGFEFFTSLARHYPSLNLTWLITGNGRMYVTGGPQSAEDVTQLQYTAPSAMNDDSDDDLPPDTLPEEDLFSSGSGESAGRRRNRKFPDESPASPEYSILRDISPKTPESAGKRHISRVIVFYDDNTFEELK